MAKIVKYHNDINKIPLRNFNEKEINLFFSLIFKAKEEGTNKINMKFVDLRKISNGDINNPRFIKSLKNLNNKLLDLKQEVILPDGKIMMFNLFNRFVIDPINKNIEIKINEDFYYMLNDLLVYTKFELEQLVGLKSSYSKNIFRLLKQFESTNFFSIYLDEFKRLLSIPESYKMSEIDRRVINPAISELSNLFPNLKLEKIKDGRKIKSLKFTWAKYCILENKAIEPIVEIMISPELNTVFEKVKKNRFIQPLLTLDNIDKLTKKYSEALLIKGLNFCYKEIKYEIKTLSYLLKTIDTGIEEVEKKIVVKEKKSTKAREQEKMKIKIIEKSNENNNELDDELKKFKEEIEEVAKKKLKGDFYPFKSKLIFANTQEKLTELLKEYKL